MKQGRQGKGTDPDVADAIRDMSLRDSRWSASAIHRVLDDDERFRGRVPEPRTITRYMTKVRTVDPAERWQLLDATLDEARLVLPVLREILQVTDGRVRWFSRAEASIIARLRAATSETIPAWNAYSYAVAWSPIHAAGGETLYHLDAAIALIDWTTVPADEAYAAYSRITEKWGRELLATLRADTKEASS
jgi:hypothetical protein